jgi:hypothetical protein
MSFVNETPFAHFMFQSLDMDGDPFQVVVLKGTFDLSPSAAPAISLEQEKVVVADERWDSGPSSSLKNEDDIAPFKPRTDILVTATSYAPGGKPAREWLAGVSVGKVAKRILVTGPRVWVHARIGGWSLGEPEPVKSVPIRYERAYGGVAVRGGVPEAYQKNPVGRGYVDPGTADKSRPIVAPNLLTPDFKLPELGKDYPVEGFSAMHKSWLPRRAKAGTFDEAWRKTRHPLVPDDFDFAFYNCAHPDLIYPGYVLGGEEVRLERLHPDHEILRFRLPTHLVAVALTDKDGYRYGGAARIDTVHIDVERMKLMLTYRATLPVFRDGVARVEAVLTESSAAKEALAAEAG